MNAQRPILYSFRRCPYAIRARMAIWAAETPVNLREVKLQDKPKALIQVSEKATVPVLLTGNSVIDESFDIMLWALRQNDPLELLGKHESELAKAMPWVTENDGQFKHYLDRYKYYDRYPEETQTAYRTKAERFVARLDQSLQITAFITGEKISIADVAIFPFVRQFAFVDKPWFDSSGYLAVRRWFDGFIDSGLFVDVMQKYPPWMEGDEALLVPELPPEID